MAFNANGYSMLQMGYSNRQSNGVARTTPLNILY